MQAPHFATVDFVLNTANALAQRIIALETRMNNVAGGLGNQALDAVTDLVTELARSMHEDQTQAKTQTERLKATIDTLKTASQKYDESDAAFSNYRTAQTKQSEGIEARLRVLEQGKANKLLELQKQKEELDAQLAEARKAAADARSEAEYAEARLLISQELGKRYNKVGLSLSTVISPTSVISKVPSLPQAPLPLAPAPISYQHRHIIVMPNNPSATPCLPELRRNIQQSGSNTGSISLEANLPNLSTVSASPLQKTTVAARYYSTPVASAVNTPLLSQTSKISMKLLPRTHSPSTITTGSVPLESVVTDSLRRLTLKQSLPSSVSAINQSIGEEKTSHFRKIVSCSTTPSAVSGGVSCADASPNQPLQALAYRHARMTPVSADVPTLPHEERVNHVPRLVDRSTAYPETVAPFESFLPEVLISGMVDAHDNYNISAPVSPFKIPFSSAVTSTNDLQRLVPDRSSINAQSFLPDLWSQASLRPQHSVSPANFSTIASTTHPLPAQSTAQTSISLHRPAVASRSVQLALNLSIPDGFNIPAISLDLVPPPKPIISASAIGHSPAQMLELLRLLPLQQRAPTTEESDDDESHHSADNAGEGDTDMGAQSDSDQKEEEEEGDDDEGGGDDDDDDGEGGQEDDNKPLTSFNDLAASLERHRGEYVTTWVSAATLAPGASCAALEPWSRYQEQVPLQPEQIWQLLAIMTDNQLTDGATAVTPERLASAIPFRSKMLKHFADAQGQSYVFEGYKNFIQAVCGPLSSQQLGNLTVMPVRTAQWMAKNIKEPDSDDAGPSAATRTTRRQSSRVTGRS